MSTTFIHSTIIAMQCDGDIEDQHRDYTIGEMQDIYSKLGEGE